MEQPQLNNSEHAVSIKSNDMDDKNDVNLKTPAKAMENGGFGVTEMKDLSTKQKLNDNVDIMQGQVGEDDERSTDLNHSFDEGDIIGTSPIKQKEKISTVKTQIQLSWHDIDIVAEPVKGCFGKKALGPDGQPMPEKQILSGISGSALPG